jgi:hypothetical protein
VESSRLRSSSLLLLRVGTGLLLVLWGHFAWSLRLPIQASRINIIRGGWARSLCRSGSAPPKSRWGRSSCWGFSAASLIRSRR